MRLRYDVARALTENIAARGGVRCLVDVYDALAEFFWVIVTDQQTRSVELERLCEDAFGCKPPYTFLHSPSGGAAAAPHLQALRTVRGVHYFPRGWIPKEHELLGLSLEQLVDEWDRTYTLIRRDETRDVLLRLTPSRDTPAIPSSAASVIACIVHLSGSRVRDHRATVRQQGVMGLTSEANRAAAFPYVSETVHLRKRAGGRSARRGGGGGGGALPVLALRCAVTMSIARGMENESGAYNRSEQHIPRTAYVELHLGEVVVDAS